ncbi:taurine ABC transporter permease TauC [uncultured Thiothrix sp.]|uniref:taurine ABC transporter permease TauC n=1 Tax=uncultured Thiothrix sp. TaxID=223185 RepID=UPI002605BC16|nr:taurine ABC transporter permease TauC [uncultured Thiothrix sp.]
MSTLESTLVIPPEAASRLPSKLQWQGFWQRHQYLLLGLISVSALTFIWWLVTALELVPSLFLPAPQAVWNKFLVVSSQGFMDATLWQHTAASLQRILLGLWFAVIIGIPVGLWIGCNQVVRGLLDPLVEIYRPIPPLAYLPLLVIWFGIGETTKVLLIFLAILAPIIIATAHGVSSAGKSRQRAAQSLGATPSQLLWHVTLPAALPSILTGVRIGLGAGWSTLVAAELVAATRGLGFMVQSAAQFLVTDTVILGILVIAAIAFAIEIGLRYLQKRLTPWYSHYE